jgi:hypothetical protein
MATGLEILGGIAASLELVKVAKDCLSVFNEIRHVGIQDRERQVLQFHFVVQGLKFERWCSALEVQDMFDLAELDKKTWAQSSRVEKFVDGLQSKLRFKNAKYAELTISILLDMSLKFGESARIMSKYSGTSPLPPPSPSLTPAASETAKNSKFSTKWSKWTGKSKESLKTPYPDSSDDVSVSRLKVGMSGVQWVTGDKSTAQGLLESIKGINDSLVELLPPNLQTQVSRQTNMAALENIDQHTNNIARSLPEGSDLRAPLCMKQWQMRSQKADDEDTASTRSGVTLEDDTVFTKPPTFSVRDFTHGTLRVGDSRSSSILKKESVVVEWKYYSDNRPHTLDHSFRLMHLVKLLNQDNLYREIAALPCKGLVEDRDNSRIGIVFATGETVSMTAKSLQDVIRSSARTPPPLGERFLIARNLALAVHNLHSMKWLHKGIRSDNVQLFTDSIPRMSTDIATRSYVSKSPERKYHRTHSGRLSRAPSPRWIC